MNTLWWLTAAVMVLGTGRVLQYGSRIVAERTGREMQAEKPLAYDLTYFGIFLGIGLLPIYAFPYVDPLFDGVFFCAGLIIGTLVAQAFFGRRTFPNASPQSSDDSSRQHVSNESASASA